MPIIAKEELDPIHLVLLEEASRGWDDVEAGRLFSALELVAKYKKQDAPEIPTATE